MAGNARNLHVQSVGTLRGVFTFPGHSRLSSGSSCVGIGTLEVAGAAPADGTEAAATVVTWKLAAANEAASVARLMVQPGHQRLATRYHVPQLVGHGTISASASRRYIAPNVAAMANACVVASFIPGPTLAAWARGTDPATAYAVVSRSTLGMIDVEHTWCAECAVLACQLVA